VPLKSKTIHAEFYCNGKLMDSYLDSLSGMTSQHLMENLGVEESTSSAVAFPVRTYQQQEKVMDSTGKGQDSGEKWRGSFAKYNPNTHSLRTHQCSLFEDSTEYCATLPRWGLMRDGECWEQQTLEQTIRGTGYGLSPDGVATFHTPNTTGLDGGSNSRKALRKRQEKFPTPTSSDHKDQPTSKSWKSKGAINYKLSNPEIRAKWPTPDANCGQRGTQDEWTPKRKSGHQAQYSINQAVRDAEKIKWPTPVKSDYAARRPSKGWQGNSDLPSVVWTETGGRENPNLSPAQLNATWVEWLMGWPIGWTDLKPLEMDKSHFAQQQHGVS
jgi:DNA (cytosine-5)-methyltransferase 1